MTKNKEVFSISAAPMAENRENGANLKEVQPILATPSQEAAEFKQLLRTFDPVQIGMTKSILNLAFAMLSYQK